MVKHGGGMLARRTVPMLLSATVHCNNQIIVWGNAAPLRSASMAGLPDHLHGDPLASPELKDPKRGGWAKCTYYNEFC